MSNSKDKSDQVVEGAIAGGLVGAVLGAFLTGKGEGTMISAIVGAAIGASIKAGEEAKNLDLPVLYEENGNIYKVYPDGRKELVRQLVKVRTRIPKRFTLE